MTDGKGGATLYTGWRCPKCQAFMRTAIPCAEVGHRCPKNNNQSTTMRGEHEVANPTAR